MSVQTTVRDCDALVMRTHHDTQHLAEEKLTAPNDPKGVWMRSLCIACVICAVINFALLVLQHGIAPLEPKPLRRISMYYGLDRVRLPTQTKQLTNYPLSLAQVSSSEPQKIYPDDPHRYPSFRGYISPEERPFLITGKVRS